MERKKVVLDASVVAKWFLEEEYSDKAIAVLADYLHGIVDIFAPDLLPYEVLNALKYSGDFGKLELVKVVGILENYQLARLPITKEAAVAAYEYGITIYDAAYVAVAKNEDATFYTADKKLLEKIDDSQWARHISQYMRTK